MYLRESKQRRADGTVVSYLQLAENVWNPERSSHLQRIAVTSPDVEVWLARLDLDGREVGQWAGVLAADERARADRFILPHDRRRFVVARSALRLLLGRKLGVAPTSVRFSYSEQGKPLLGPPHPHLNFNVSHSGERALYALSEKPVGVDIELLREDVDVDALAKRYFTPNESRELLQLPAQLRIRAFFACWTRKEAILKATGQGLSVPLDAFEVSVDPDAPPRLIDPGGLSALEWSLYTVHAGENYHATVSLHHRDCATPAGSHSAAGP